MALIRSFMAHGHLQADIDPLHLSEIDKVANVASTYMKPGDELKRLIEYDYYGFTEKDLDRVFYVDVPQLGGLLQKKKEWTLRELDQALRSAYCGKIGVEFMHIAHREQCTWIRNKFELA
jgi:2-oxoglutarate dehydrogenase E1 component